MITLNKSEETDMSNGLHSLKSTFVYNHSIETLWSHLSNIKNLFALLKFNKDIKLIHGSSWGEVGSKFSVNYKNQGLLKYKVLSYLDTENRKRVELECYESFFGVLNTLSYEFVRLTGSNSTLYVYEVFFQNIIFKEIMTMIRVENKHSFKQMDKRLTRIRDNLKQTVQTESTIIKTNKIQLWELITDFKLLCKLIPDFADSIHIEEGKTKLEEGQILKIEKSDLGFVIELKITTLQSNIDKKVWKLCYESDQITKKIKTIDKYEKPDEERDLGSYCQYDTEVKIPKQKVIIELEEITTESTLFTFTHQIQAAVKDKVLDKLKNQKYEFIKCVKKMVRKKNIIV